MYMDACTFMVMMNDNLSTPHLYSTLSSVGKEVAKFVKMKYVDILLEQLRVAKGKRLYLYSC